MHIVELQRDYHGSSQPLYGALVLTGSLSVRKRKKCFIIKLIIVIIALHKSMLKIQGRQNISCTYICDIFQCGTFTAFYISNIGYVSFSFEGVGYRINSIFSNDDS